MILLPGPILTAAGERGPAWVADGVIHYGTPSSGTSETLEGFVLPGLVDVHSHIGLGLDGGVDRETSAAQAITDRDAGILLIRDAGVPVDTRWIDERADLPRLIRAGRHIARPKRYIRGYPIDLDDVREFPEEMARQARAGGGWVKIVADWIDRSLGKDAVLTPLWPADVLRDGIAAAHENGARVMAHTFVHTSIDPLLEAGIDCIEHGTGMDADQMDEAARRGIPVTPTLVQVDTFADIAAGGAAKYPAYAAQMRAMYERREQHVRDLVAAGVQLLPGSDAGGTLPHGLMPRELLRWQEAGIDPAEVVAFATWRVRQFLGAGTLGEGESADLVVYDEDPRLDVAHLAHPRAIVLRGVRVR